MGTLYGVGNLAGFQHEPNKAYNDEIECSDPDEPAGSLTDTFCTNQTQLIKKIVVSPSGLNEDLEIDKDDSPDKRTHISSRSRLSKRKGFMATKSSSYNESKKSFKSLKTQKTTTKVNEDPTNNQHILETYENEYKDGIDGI